MKLEEIHDEWARDCVIDETELATVSREIPRLHSKYLRFLSEERMIAKKLENDLRIMESDVTDRLSGTMSQEDLNARGWQPERRKMLKMEVEKKLAVDRNVVELKLRLALQHEKMEVLDSMVRMIVNRNFVVKNMIDWIKFKGGAI